MNTETPAVRYPDLDTLSQQLAAGIAADLAAAIEARGLASLVAEAVFDARLVRPLERVGLPDQFIECGSVSFLQSKYGLTPEHIVEAARRALTREK